MMKFRYSIISLIVLLFTPHALYAAAESAGAILLKSPHARPAGLAEAYSSIGADRGGISAIHYNPAASGFLKKREIALMGNRGVAEDNFGSLFYGYPTRMGNLSGEFVYYSIGNIELINDTGSISTVKAQEDLLFNFNYGREWLENISFGSNIKILRSKLIGSLSAMAFALDVGAQARRNKWTGGVSIQNVGTKLQYVDVGESLPMTFRAGVSRSFGFRYYGESFLAMDLVKEKGESIKEFVGAEFIWKKQLAVRVGYKFGQDLGKLNVGMGFTASGFDIDYGMSDMGGLGRTHTASISYKFKGSEIKTLPFMEFLHKKKNHIILVLDLQSNGVTALRVQPVTDAIVTILSEKGDPYTVIDRKNIDESVKAHYSNCINAACASEIGRRLDAQNVIIGSVVRRDKIYVLEVQLVDVKKGKVVRTETVPALSIEKMRKKVKKIIEKLIRYR